MGKTVWVKNGKKEPFTKIVVNKKIANNDDLLRQTLAHEIIHHHLYQKYGNEVAKHGEHFNLIADRINSKEGDNFVSQFADKTDFKPNAESKLIEPDKDVYTDLLNEVLDGPYDGWIAVGQGYHDYSKSNRALEAERDDRYPLTKAAQILAKKLNWSTAKAKAFLLSVGTSEWHHTSCKYNATNYYDVSDEYLNEIKDKIENFKYTPEKRKESKLWFKCWNINGDDVRKWDWKITNKESNHCYKVKEVKEKLEKLLVEWTHKVQETNKTKQRIANETIKTIKDILSQIEKKVIEPVMGGYVRGLIEEASAEDGYSVIPSYSATWYHGSTTPVAKFDVNKGSGQFGKGLYLGDKDIAEFHAKGGRQGHSGQRLVAKTKVKLSSVTAGISDTVYHYTSISSAANILEENRFALTFISGSDDVNKPKDKYYYLSTTRSKIGSYHIGSTFGVLLKLNGTSLRNNYVGNPVDYWGREFRKVAPSKNEMEDRIWSAKPFIEPATKYIEEVHIYFTDVTHEGLKKQLRHLLIEAKKRKIPTYLYTDIESAKLLDKRNGIPLSKIDIKTEPSEPSRSFGRRDYMAPWLELYEKKDAAHLSTEAKRRLEGFYYADDINVFKADIHNSKKGTPALHKIIDILKKNKWSIEDFYNHIQKKWTTKKSVG